MLEPATDTICMAPSLIVLTTPDLVAAIAAGLVGGKVLRGDLVAAARARVRSGRQPDAGTLADAVLRELAAGSSPR